MKRTQIGLLALLLAILLGATQAQETTITQQELEARRAAAHEKGRQMSEFLNQRTAEAQALQASNRAVTVRVKGFGETPKASVVQELPKRQVYYNTNANGPGLANFIKMMERHQPGISTNFTAAQRSNTNKPVVEAIGRPRPQ